MLNLKVQNVFHFFTIHWTHFVSLLNHNIPKEDFSLFLLSLPFVPLLIHKAQKGQNSFVLYLYDFQRFW